RRPSLEIRERFPQRSNSPPGFVRTECGTAVASWSPWLRHWSAPSGGRPAISLCGTALLGSRDTHTRRSESLLALHQGVLVVLPTSERVAEATARGQLL